MFCRNDLAFANDEGEKLIAIPLRQLKSYLNEPSLKNTNPEMRWRVNIEYQGNGALLRVKNNGVEEQISVGQFLLKELGALVR